MDCDRTEVVEIGARQYDGMSFKASVRSSAGDFEAKNGMILGKAGEEEGWWIWCENVPGGNWCLSCLCI